MSPARQSSGKGNSRIRDDFSTRIIANLAKRANYICSNPDCRKPTAGPHSNPEKAMSIGVAAHICAASPGGPRYDPSQTPEERASIENGIWLCQDCSVIIDRDPAKHPADLLRKWKREHEEWVSKTKRFYDGTAKALSNLFQLPPAPADFTGREEQIKELLGDFKFHKGATISGLTGMGGIGKTALGLVVANRLAENYSDAQIFLDLKGTTTPLTAVDIARHVILSFEPTADLRALDETNLSPAYQSVLHGRKALLFFDNAHSTNRLRLYARQRPAPCSSLHAGHSAYPASKPAAWT
jgi:hypothetical protein